MSGFGSQDLLGMFGSSGGGSEDEPEKFKPQFDQSKRQARLRAGVLPKWAQYEEEIDEFQIATKGTVKKGTPKASEAQDSSVSAKPEVIDRRLALVNHASPNLVDPSGAPRRRRVYEAEVILEEGADSPNASSSSGAAPNASMKTIDSSLGQAAFDGSTQRRRAVAHAEVLPPPTADSSSSEYETDTDASSSEEDNAPEKPQHIVFIPRKQREMQKAALQQEEEGRRKKTAEQAKKRQNTSRSMVAASIRRSEIASIADDGNDSDAGLPDDADNVDPQTERERWEVRELERIQRDISDKAVLLHGEQELRMRSRMTDEQVEALQKSENPHKNNSVSGDSHGQTRKKYHKGAFFMDDDSLSVSDPRRRDMSGFTASEASFYKATSKSTDLKNASFRTSSGKYSAAE